MDFFSAALAHDPNRPLAERLRPQSLSEMVGQSGLFVGRARWKDAAQVGGPLPSLILFGPPGCGKTTFAKIICARSDVFTETCHAIETGSKLLKEVCERARLRKFTELKKKTLVFVDEIHRLNRAQQDVLLSSLESGDVSLLGATTENPSHTLNPALISRCQVIPFEPLVEAALDELVQRAFRFSERDIDRTLSVEARQRLLQLSDGDARRLINFAEWLFAEPEPAVPFNVDELVARLGSLAVRFDRAGQEHHDLISALIKSIRGSDPDAALYYLARLVKGGEDVAFLARRLMILASEDIGNADPRALQIAVSGAEAVTRIGWPEAAIVFGQIVAYLACAPKSNASYSAINAALAFVEQTGSRPVPLALRSSKTALSRSLGYGKSYGYSHDGPRGFIAQDFMPDGLAETRFLELTDRGFEKTMRQYQDWVRGREKKSSD